MPLIEITYFEDEFTDDERSRLIGACTARRARDGTAWLLARSDRETVGESDCFDDAR